MRPDRDLARQLSEWNRAMRRDLRLCRLEPLRDDPGSLDLETASRAAALEKCSFSRYFHDRIGVRFRDWRTALKVGQATVLLRETDQCTETIALSVGFGDVRSLRRAMNRMVGCGPREYRHTDAAIERQLRAVSQAPLAKPTLSPSRAPSCSTFSVDLSG